MFKKIFKHSFTLIELIVVIVILGILAAIVVPNISNWKNEAEITAVNSNQRNLQTSVDMYSLENFGIYPVETPSFAGVSSPLDFRKLYPDYLRNLPKTEGYKYWVDYQGKVWYSTIDSPTGVALDEQSKELSWNEVEDSEKYGVYKLETGATSSAKSTDRLTFVKEVTEPSTTVDSSGVYAVSAFDENGFETPPATSEYQGYPENADYLMPIGHSPQSGSKEGEESSNPPASVDPKVAGPIVWKGLQPESTDRDGNTYSNVYTNPITWDGDLSRRVVHFDIANPSSNGANIYIRDVNGNNLEFYDVNNNQMTRKNVYNRTQFSIVIPKGAASILVAHTYDPATIYDIHVDPDNTFPDPIKNLTITPNMLSNTLKWDNPTDSDIKNVAIFRDGKFVGISSTGVFEDKPLYANTTYNYELESADAVGNRSTRVAKSTTTLPRQIEWSGLEPAGFDFDSNTAVTHAKGGLITWTGDLTNRVVHIDMENPSSNGAWIYVRNDSNQNLTFQNAKTGELLTGYKIYSRSQIDIVIPEGATKILIAESYSAAKVYDIHESEDLILPNPVTNIQTTSGEHSITLSWNPPNDLDYQKAAIFRNGQFVAFATNNTYTDTPLYTGETYTYDIKAVDNYGNQSVKTTKTASTIARSIKWSGLDAGGFDGNAQTSSTHVKGGKITWTGNLVGKTVYFDLENPSSNGANIFVKDANNQNLTFTNVGTGTPVTSMKVYNRTQFSIVIPENASYILIAETYSSAKVYDIIER